MKWVKNIVSCVVFFHIPIQSPHFLPFFMFSFHSIYFFSTSLSSLFFPTSLRLQGMGINLEYYSHSCIAPLLLLLLLLLSSSTSASPSPSPSHIPSRLQELIIPHFTPLSHKTRNGEWKMTQFITSSWLLLLLLAFISSCFFNYREETENSWDFGKGEKERERERENGGAINSPILSSSLLLFSSLSECPYLKQEYVGSWLNMRKHVHITLHIALRKQCKI